MSRLIWGEAPRKYEAGVDRGVFYPENAPGVVWNGLVSIDEGMIGGEVNSYYYDGIKYIDLVSTKNFQATLTAFSAPEEFSVSLGDLAIVPGFILTRQRRSRFGLSYRTLIGEVGYKLHLVYNAIASPSSRGYATQSDSANVSSLAWVIDAVPPPSGLFRPSAHFIIDSTKSDPNLLESLETIMYGTTTDAPRMPRVDELMDIIVSFEPLYIVPDDISGLSELVPGMGDLYRTGTPGLLRELPDTRLFETSVHGLYRME